MPNKKLLENPFCCPKGNVSQLECVGKICVWREVDEKLVSKVGTMKEGYNNMASNLYIQEARHLCARTLSRHCVFGHGQVNPRLLQSFLHSFVFVASPKGWILFFIILFCSMVKALQLLFTHHLSFFLSPLGGGIGVGWHIVQALFFSFVSGADIGQSLGHFYQSFEWVGRIHSRTFYERVSSAYPLLPKEPQTHHKKNSVINVFKS